MKPKLRVSGLVISISLFQSKLGKASWIFRLLKKDYSVFQIMNSLNRFDVIMSTLSAQEVKRD